MIAYIMGGDHHNGYGIARHLGKSGIEVHSLIITDKRKSWLSKSKYIKSSMLFKTEREAVDYLKTINSETKSVLIPYSDKAALEVDNRIEELDCSFYFPNFNNTAGKLKIYADKLYQCEMAQKNGIPCAQSFVYKSGNMCAEYSGKYPCILKPRNSYDGKKEDIIVCNSYDELEKTIRLFVAKGYKEILIQEFLSIDYEIDVFGAIDGGQILSIFPHKILRRWPNIGGTSSYTYVLTDTELIEFCKKVLNIVIELGYSGLYDLELFYINGVYYLNEINYRNSGSSFRAIGQDFNYIYNWCCHLTDCANDNSILVPTRNDYTMTEYPDVRHVFRGDISLGQWLKDFKMCSCFSIFNKDDVLPLIYKLIYSIGVKKA